MADLEQQLRSAGLRVTSGRISVLEQLELSPHSNAESLHKALSEADVATSVQSVHNVLADLTAAGIVRRIEPAGSAALFERRVDDNHHHLVCTSCGAVADVDCVTGHAPCLTPSNIAGYAVSTAEVTFWGICPSCQSTP